ncbi:hypothetical protein [Bartonella florencae]|uniref:hypothetical protein n=1 Tax=Bartonella florencae TaxID=928210 RepID=UPI00031CD7FD|nr:hypothetical protein [Bartonella florencae]
MDVNDKNFLGGDSETLEDVLGMLERIIWAGVVDVSPKYGVKSSMSFCFIFFLP